jgi:Na+/pantothenate symporter
MVGLTFVVLAVVVLGVVVLALGLVVERLARRSRAGAPPRP